MGRSSSRRPMGCTALPYRLAQRGASHCRAGWAGRRTMTARIWVEAVAHTAEGERRFIVRGQTAKGLIALVNGWRLRRDSHGGGEPGIQVRGLLPPTSHAVR